jgi:two-component system nitrate/nitrite response regulator NarL
MAGSVLVVDDDPSFLSLAGRVLERAGLDVVGTAVDAPSAIAAVHELKPQAVLVDVGLPGRDGIDLGRELAALPWAPRVVLTSTDRDVMSALPAGDPARELPFVPKVDLPGAPLRRMLGAD